MRQFDALIVGQGLAGTTLAWRLLKRGARVAIADSDLAPSASRVAAGLLAPVGGKRLALAWRVAQAWPAALAFYREVEEQLKRQLLRDDPFVRLFVDAEQQAEFQHRASRTLAEYLVSHSPELTSGEFAADAKGFQVCGARLDVSGYLDKSRKYFRELGIYHQSHLQLDGDLEFREQSVVCEQLGVEANRLILCRGFADANSTLGLSLPFEPAQGEVLTLRIPDLHEQRVVQCGVWLAPRGDGLYRAGSTFDRARQDGQPTAEGRRQIEHRLQQFLSMPYEVVDHRAGVRPIVKTRRPLVGPLPGNPGIVVFNGLGASGTLWAPWLAEQLAGWLLDRAPLPAEVDPRRRLSTP